MTRKIEFKCWVKLRKSSKASEFIAQGDLELSLVKVKLNTYGKEAPVSSGRIFCALCIKQGHFSTSQLSSLPMQQPKIFILPSKINILCFWLFPLIIFFPRWFWFFPEQSRMKGLLYTPGFSVHLDVLVWGFFLAVF